MVVKGSPIDFQLRYSVEQYHELIRSGSISESDSIELLEGQLVEKMARNTPHDVTLQKLTRQIRKLLPEGLWDLRTQSAITLDTSEPEPDGAIVLEPPDRYLDHHPYPNDIALVIEIAESSLEQDRGIKQRIYARSGILVYWIINLIERQIEVYSDPDSLAEKPKYQSRQDYREGESLPLLIQGNSVGSINVRDLFPQN